jgi:hypothetical protein
MSKPLSATLQLLQEGGLNVRAGDLLAGIVKAVEETGKPGKLTLTIDIKKVGAALSVAADVTDKTPVEKPAPDMLWGTVEGNLSESNPNQRKLDLQPVAAQTRVLNAG